MNSLQKTSATSFTAGLGDLGPVNGSVDVPGQFIPINTTVNYGATIKIPKSQALSNLRLNWGAAGSVRGLTTGWYLVPQTLQALDASTRPGSITQTYSRTSGQINVNVAYRGGSGGFQLPAHTVSLIATFYQLPF